MNTYFLCPCCFTVHRAPDATCCGERGHVEPVITSFVFPAIPIRTHDWCAYLDVEGTYGRGETEQAAVDDLADALLLEGCEDETYDCAIHGTGAGSDCPRC